MKKRRRDITSSNGVSIPMTPLIDIVFLLLIYFMLASHFIQEEQQFAVELPQSSQGAKRIKAPMVVTLMANGKIFLDKDEIDLSGLKDQLKKVPPLVKKRGLEIRAERTVPVQSVVKVLDVAKACGLKRVRITTRGEEN